MRLCPPFSYPLFTGMPNFRMLRAVAAVVISASMAALTIAACASSPASDSNTDRLLIFQARSTAIAAQQSGQTQSARYATAQAASDAAQERLAEIDANAQRLFGVFERGAVRCGIHPDRPAYSHFEEDDGYVGFFADLCRAVATATLGSPFAVEFVEIERGREGEKLSAGEIDILSASVDWNIERESEWGHGTLPVHFGGYTFLIPSESPPSEPRDLVNNTVCTIEDSLEERVFLEWKNASFLDIEVMQFANLRHQVSAYELGFCTAIPGDQPTLSQLRRDLETPANHRILDTPFTEVRAVLAVPDGSDQWFDLVKFVMAGIVQAELLGVTSENAEESRSNQNIAVRRLGGYEGDFGQDDLNIDVRVLQRVVSEVGDYGEIYDRHFNNDDLRIKRADNRLWTEGGRIYAPPLR